jgi:hypothetical protein
MAHFLIAIIAKGLSTLGNTSSILFLNPLNISLNGTILFNTQVFFDEDLFIRVINALARAKQTLLFPSIVLLIKCLL